MSLIFKHTSIQLEQLSDLELIRQYKNSGEQVYFITLYQRYTHLTYSVCLKYLKQHETAQDAVMEIFEKLINDLKKQDIQYFKAWLYQVAKNYCLMQLRKKQTNFIDLEKVSPSKIGIVENDPHLHLDANSSDVEKDLAIALDQLNDEQKLCVGLFYLQQKSYQDIANQTGFTLNQVKSYIQNGKRNLKGILENKRNTSNE